MTLDGSSAATASKVTLDKHFVRKPAPVTYAFDVRVDQTGPAQAVEFVSLRTADFAVTLAFHIGIADGSFIFAEFAKGTDPPADYSASTLALVDAAWHRFEVQITYEAAVQVSVRVDGRVVIAPRAIKVVPAAAPTTEMVFAVGVNDIESVTGNLSYLIDNATLSN